MLRRAAVLVAGLAMTASLGLAGAGAASATAPATDNVGNHTTWTMKPVGGGACEWDKFNTTKDTFVSTSEPGDAGTFSQTNTTIDMTWTAGPHTGWTFQGTWNGKVYSGLIGGTAGGVRGRLVSGARPRC
jgi:hypothetical protein